MASRQKISTAARIDALRNNSTVKAAASDLGLSERGFADWLKRNGIDAKEYLIPGGYGRRLSPEESERRIATVTQCRTIEEAATQLGMKYSRLRNWISHNNLRHLVGQRVKSEFKPINLRPAEIGRGMPREEARKHAADIRRYWRSQGYHVDAWAARMHTTPAVDPDTDIFEVQSDLINGLPRDWKGRAA